MLQRKSNSSISVTICWLLAIRDAKVAQAAVEVVYAVFSTMNTVSIMATPLLKATMKVAALELRRKVTEKSCKDALGALATTVAL